MDLPAKASSIRHAQVVELPEWKADAKESRVGFGYPGDWGYQSSARSILDFLQDLDRMTAVIRGKKVEALAAKNSLVRLENYSSSGGCSFSCGCG